MNGTMGFFSSRRRFLQKGAACAGLASLAGLGALSAAQEMPAEEDQPKPEGEGQEQPGGEKQGEGETGIGPVEDLMREHGALDRILLIYDDAIARLRGKRDFPADTLAAAAGIVEGFIQDYHEKLEEDHVFPRFEKGSELGDLAATLLKQHEAGRALTAQILAGAASPDLNSDAGRGPMIELLSAFLFMYRPHKAREDTILFPAFHAAVPPAEFDDLGAKFEDKETELFGENGFEKVVDEIANLEKKLGLYDLDAFTPPV
ncbi:MAG: hemerythrin domain-containing protein [Candidatus Sumerlaeota bacterium]|nr:hemerythrin domain-containing protein [Candidatus Sumerlaeota bacterium]